MSAVKKIVKRKERHTARLDFRLPTRDKRLIEQAASVTGQTVTSFAVPVLLQSAKEVLEREQITKLTNRDRDIFLKLLDSNVEPNSSLKRAAERYKREYVK